MGVNINSNQSYTGLVQKYIGSAYDKMALISDNLEALLKLAQDIEDGTLDELLALIPTIEESIERVDEFFNLYYGSLPTEPTTKPNGEPTEPGDLYFNTTDELLYVYSNDGWEGTGVVDRLLEQFIITQDQADLNASAPIRFSLRNKYKVDSNNLFVFVNREHHFSTSVVAASNGTASTYTEIDVETIEFPTGTFVEGDILLLGVNTETSTVTHMVDVDRFVYTTLTPNERDIVLPAELSYKPGENNIKIWEARVIQITEQDYDEVTPLLVRMVNPMTQGTEVLVEVGNVISNVASVPRVLFQDPMPELSLYVDGQFWFDVGKARMFVKYTDVNSSQWVSIAGEDNFLLDGGDPITPETPDPVQVRETLFQEAQPDPSLYSEGALWFKTSSGELFILYDDPTIAEQHWVKVST